MSEDFERAQAYLKKTDPKSNSGRSVYDHLSDMVLSLLRDKPDPDNAIARLEALSVSIKKQHQGNQLNQLKELHVLPRDEASKSRLLNSVTQTLSLCEEVANTIETESTNPSHVPDLLAQEELLQQAGIGFGQEFIYELSLSMKKLVKDENLETVRLFGKFFGTRSDYIVVEAKPKSWSSISSSPISTTPSTSPKMEPPGTGANAYLYYVTTTSSSTSSASTTSSSHLREWRLLPHILPEQILLSRVIRRYLTGDLEACINGYPRFQWPEACYLRAQIARISSTTIISPKGYYTLEEQDDGNEVMINDDEWMPMSATDMIASENWIHHRSYLLKQGRCEPYIPPEKNDEDVDDEDVDDDSMDGRKEEEEEEEEEEEVSIPLLSTIEGDEDQGVRVPLWIFRVHPRADLPHAVVEVRSTLWPGAITVTKGNMFVNMYIGYGHKWMNGKVFTPAPAPVIQKEFIAPYNPEEDEYDPMIEQEDPLPPADLPEDRDEEDQEEDEDREEDGDDDDDRRDDDDDDDFDDQDRDDDQD